MLTVYVTTESNCYISGLHAWGTTYDTYSRREFIQYFANRMDKCFDDQESLRKKDNLSEDENDEISYLEGMMNEQDAIMNMIDIMKSKIHNEIIWSEMK